MDKVGNAADAESVTRWLNEIALSQSNAEKVELLHKIQETLLRKSPALLSQYLDDVLNSVTERSADVKKVLVGFIEEACKLTESALTKVMFSLHMMLCDESIAVQKRVIQAAITVYRIMVGWLCRQSAAAISDDVKQAWTTLDLIKKEIANMIDSDNDGVRTSSAKFLECVVLVQSYCDPNEPKSAADLSLDDVPMALKLVKRRTLEEEADTIFAVLVKFNGSAHISSANLCVCIGVLTNIARLRPEYMGQVVAALSGLHTNLPPTLSSTQVTAVRKKLKSELSTLVKHPAGQDYLDTIQPRLIELGCSQIEVAKMVPRIDEYNRRQYSAKRSLPPSGASDITGNGHNADSGAKRARLDLDLDIMPELELGLDPETRRKVDLAIEANCQFIMKHLDNNNAVQLVIKGSANVPDTAPPTFTADYDDTLLMGPAGDKRIIAKFLAEQMVEAGAGPGVRHVGATALPKRQLQQRKVIVDMAPKLQKQRSDDMIVTTPMEGVIEEEDIVMEAEEKGKKGKEAEVATEKVIIPTKLAIIPPILPVPPPSIPTPVPPPTTAASTHIPPSAVPPPPPAAAKVKTLKLTEITRPLSKPAKKTLLLGAVKRLLQSVTASNQSAAEQQQQQQQQVQVYNAGGGGVRQKLQLHQMQNKIVTTLAATFSDVVRESILEHLVGDLKRNIDIALGWLYEEYSIMQGFSRIPELRRTTRIEHSYNNLLAAFVRSACGAPPASITPGAPPPAQHTPTAPTAADGATLARILLEAPIVTEPSLEQVAQTVCRREETAPWAFGLLRELAVRRPTRQSVFVGVILVHTTHDNEVIREHAVKNTLLLYPLPTLKPLIDAHILKCVDALTESHPPAERLAGEAQGRVKMESWSDSLAQACLEAFIAVLPRNEALIHCLARVYVQTGADVKRTILRMLDAPIRAMGMSSPELLKLVEDCPKGSETLVTRVIHILTDKDLPSQALVLRVRELYNTRVSDVRFLIPVLNGLTKAEILAAMPKLIKLNPVVVKEVFNRLLGAHGESSISPTELLVSLHIIDTNKADIKTKMKAITMCLNEKQVFTQEVLAVVLQQLMEHSPLPTLLMRTVIQGMGFYPRLSGFVMNILQRLILKQVWKQRVVWEGFVKCCQRTKPQSFGVLMQLPAAQLSEALTMCPDLREPLKDNLMTFTDGQRSHIPSAVQDILMGIPVIPTGVPPPILPEPVPAPQELLIINPLEPLPPGMD